MRHFQFVMLFFLLSFSWPNNGIAQDVATLKESLETTQGIERLGILHKLTKSYNKISLDTSIWFARQAIQLAQTLENDSLIADAHLQLCPSFYFAGMSDSTLLHAGIAKEIGEQLQSAEIIGYACQLMASAYESQANFEKALDYNKQSLAAYKSFDDLVGMGAIHQNLSSLYVKTGDLDTALEYAIVAEKIAAQTGRRNSQGLVAMNIADIYSRLNKQEKHTEYLLKAKAIFTRDSFPRRHANVLNFIANKHYNHQQIDSAIYYFEQSLAIQQEIGSAGGIATTHGNLGSMYQEIEEWDKSYFHLHKALWLKQKTKNHFAATYDLLNLGSHFDLQNKPDSAIYYFTKSLEFAEENDISQIEEVALQQLFAFYEKTGQYQEAFTYHKRYHAFVEEVKGLETEKKIASLEAQYDSEKKEQEIARLALSTEVQTAKARALQFGLASLFLLAALLIGGILYRRSNERKVNLLQQQLHEQEKKEMDQELAYKNKQLTSHALHMVQKNKVLQEIKQEITNLSKTADANSKKALRALIRRIDFDIQSDEDWNTFKLYFEETNQDFYVNLAKINKDLTSTELKLCSLIKLNMNIKETASVLNIEPTSVKTARHRLRKKLRLEQGQDLTSFIRQVA